MRLNVCFFGEMVPFGPFAGVIKRTVARMRGMTEMEVSSQEEMANRQDMKCPCKYIRGKCRCTADFVSIRITQIFYLGTCTFIRARFTAVLYIHISVTAAVPVHIMSYECSSTYVYTLCTMISTALLSCSISSTNECPRIK